MFSLTEKDEHIRHNVSQAKATIKFEASLDQPEIDLEIGVFGTVIIEGQEHSAHVSTESLYLNEGKLPNKSIKGLDGLVLFENLYQGDESSTKILLKGQDTELLGSHEDSITYCYVDQPLEMAVGVISLQHLSGTRFKLIINGDIDLYIVEADIEAAYLGGSIIIRNEVGEAAQQKLLDKFERTFISDDHRISFRESNGHTYLEFVPR